MQAAFNAFIFNLKYYGFWVLYFVIARLLFIGYHFGITKTLAPSELFFVFGDGLRLDMSIAACIVIIPFVLVLLRSFLSERTVRIPMLWVGGALESKRTVNTNLGSQVDLAYTLLDLLGADNSAFEFRTHLFNSSKEQFVHYVFNQGFGAINDSGFLVYDFIKKDAVQTSDSKQETLKANGSAILQTAYQDLLEK